MTSSLEVLLARAARSPDWARDVVHRCAWCKRLTTHGGQVLLATPPRETVAVSDGMCAACAVKALATIGRRRTRRSARRAA